MGSNSTEIEIKDNKQADNDIVLEESLSDSSDGVLEEEVVESTPKKAKPLSKNEEAKELMKNSEELISAADSEVQATKEVVKENVAKFEDVKATLSNTTITQSMILLEKANYEYTKEQAEEPFEVSVESMMDHFTLANISSGRFTGFLLAILGIIATAVAWLFVASSKTGTEITPDKIPDDSVLQTLFTWIGGGMTGGEGNPLFGMITLGVTALLIGWAIYKLRVAMRENKNYRVAHETFDKSHGYVESQKEAKTEMEHLDEHIRVCTPLIEDYKVLLDEQNAKLKRVLHIEGALENSSDYHYSSQQTMQESAKLMDKVEHLISTPMTKEGKLNEASTYAYIEAKALYEHHISKLYA
ncbi:MAG: hypothetical protein K0U38_02490 [Epsilonproteobacteria bacterium]|nr:hypothetical protein [Campylobacterota bacterium]